MNDSIITDDIKLILKGILESQPKVSILVNLIDKAGGTVVLVGGAVRDLFLNLPCKDLDIEVHGLSLDTLQGVLQKMGQVNVVGKSFGVLRVSGVEADWSVPRRDSSGRKPVVDLDVSMSFEDAFERRDLTINSMGINLISYRLIDVFNGYDDLKKGILRAPNIKKFIEDPLRFYRVMQFVGRFGFAPDQYLTDLCKTMDIAGVSVERIEGECNKLLLRSKRPSLGFRWLDKIGRLAEIFPELSATRNVPQEIAWHPEGDVFEHTMQSLDAAAALPIKDEKRKSMVMYATLCHDLGKPETTEEVGGRFKSFGHAKAGVQIAKNFLSRFSRDAHLISAVGVLVRHHMMPAQLVAAQASLSAYKRLAKKLYPFVTMQDLADVALSDKRGRNPLKNKPLTKEFSAINAFIKKAEKAQVLMTIEKPVLQGRDLLDSMPEGPALGELLCKAYEIQIEEGIIDKDELRQRVLKNK